MIYVVEQSPGFGIFGLAEGTYRFGKSLKGQEFVRKILGLEKYFVSS